MKTTRPIFTKKSLLNLCEAIAGRPELAHLYETDHYPESMGSIIAFEALDIDEDSPTVFGLPDKFRLLYPDTYLKLHLIQQHFRELKDVNGNYYVQEQDSGTQVVSSIAGKPLAGLKFEYSARVYDKCNYVERVKYYHDLIDETEQRIDAMRPDNPAKLKRIPFAFGPWMPVVQTETGDSSVLVAMGGFGCSDSGSCTELAFAKPATVIPDTPHCFNEEEENCLSTTPIEWKSLWFGGLILADWFVNETVPDWSLVELIDIYIRDGEFKAGPLTETFDEMHARFVIEHPSDEE